jgi:hypothetical protein
MRRPAVFFFFPISSEDFVEGPVVLCRTGNEPVEPKKRRRPMFAHTKLVLAALAVMLTLGGAARASDPYYSQPTYVYKKVISYETQTCYETRSEAYQYCVIKYDYCGCPYKTYETRYREYQVPVYKQVAIVKYIRVPVY